jgi:hypothetical protein
MGGALTVKSTPAQGSTFQVRIPAQAVAPLPIEDPEHPAVHINGYRRTLGAVPLRILIADDEADNREILHHILNIK